MKIQSHLILFVLYSLLIAPSISNPILDDAIDSTYNTTEFLNVHLIPHTHNDIGWLKTIDQYYYGSWNNITWAGVQYILDSVIGRMIREPTMKFIYVEIAFFTRWWNEQSVATQIAVKTLVKTGNLVFINAGWCMNDEAAVYYEDSIDQMQIGHLFVKDTFNFIPTIGWHIDPFGHSAAQAAMFAQMGFKAFFFARIDYQDRNKRLSEHGMEMVWNPQTSQGIENSIFTSVNYDGYGYPDESCYDIRCSDEPVMDDPDLEGYNLDYKSDIFAQWFRKMSEGYAQSELLQTAGGDFNYQDTNVVYKNLNKVVNFINNNPQRYNMKIDYSTPDRYIDTINKLGKTYPFKYDDFFPYANNQDGYWTGYHTSRVASKIYVKQTGRFAQSVKKLILQDLWYNQSSFIVNEWSRINEALWKIEYAIGYYQHHDAVTGTERQQVVWDYNRYMSKAIGQTVESILKPYFNDKLGLDRQHPFEYCYMNISAIFCSQSFNSLQNNRGVIMAIYNPGQARSSFVRAKVPHGNIQVTDSDSNVIDTASVLCSNSTDPLDCDLFFKYSFNGYSINYLHINPSSNSILVQPQPLNDGKVFDINSDQKFTVKTLQTFSLSYANGKSFDYLFEYNYYPGLQSETPCDVQTSNAFVFRPTDATKAGSINYDVIQSGLYWEGNGFIQIQLRGAKLYQNLRIYGDFIEGLEYDTFVDSIPVDDGIGKEIVFKISTQNINNEQTFYTDSMGMELQKRIFNFRPTWNLEVHQPVSGNYYPIQSLILINDTTTGLGMGIMPDRAEAGGSINNGEIELLVHRRLLLPGCSALNEALNELDWDGKGLRQWIKHRLIVVDEGLETDHRKLQYYDDQPLLTMVGENVGEGSRIEIEDLEEPLDTFTNVFGADGDDTFDYIKVWGRAYGLGHICIRFQNMDEKNNRTVPTSFFNTTKFNPPTVEEYTLSFNQPKADMILNKLNWNGIQYNDPKFINNDYKDSDHFLLRPLEIRTFNVTFKANADDLYPGWTKFDNFKKNQF